jgi:hypothetical protein
MRLHFIRMLPADKVMLQVFPYDLSKGRINLPPEHEPRTCSAFFVSTESMSYESATIS